MREILLLLLYLDFVNKLNMLSFLLNWTVAYAFNCTVAIVQFKRFSHKVIMESTLLHNNKFGESFFCMERILSGQLWNNLLE